MPFTNIDVYKELEETINKLHNNHIIKSSTLLPNGAEKTLNCWKIKS